jgi:hypothetical protein
MLRPLDRHRNLLDDLTRAVGNLASQLLLAAEGWREGGQAEGEPGAPATTGELSRAPPHLAEMLRSHGIDPDRVRINREFLAIERRCIRCDRRRRCRDWLASPEPERGLAGFCPSFAAFALIRDYQRPHPPRSSAP